MADGQSGPSMDYGYVDSAINQLRSEMRGEMHQLKSWTEHEIQRLENEMREIGEMIVRAIDKQTMAVVGGVAATTLMIERTKQQIEEDFSQTRNKLELQLESTLQIEVGKKLADAGSARGKLDAFISDIKSRFDKSIAGIAINRELYNLNFRKITEEYENKIKTIGEHIFQVKLEDIAPAIKAAQVPYEITHGLPIELDLKRLSARAENLDETLTLLRSSRVDEVLSSLETLDTALDSFAAGETVPRSDVSLCVEGLATASPVSTKVFTGMVASQIKGDSAISLSLSDSSLALFSSKEVEDHVQQTMAKRNFRDLSGPEVVALSKAARELESRKLISDDARALLEDFLGSGNLKYLEA
jgi:hypothetical protein